MSRSRRARARCSAATHWPPRAQRRISPSPSRRARSAGRKRRAETDREDARWLRELLSDGRLPEAWIPPEHVRRWRPRTRMRHTLIDERTACMQRIQATLFHRAPAERPTSRVHVRAASSSMLSSSLTTRAIPVRSSARLGTNGSAVDRRLLGDHGPMRGVGRPPRLPAPARTGPARSDAGRTRTSTVRSFA
jgi:hypothetical protein